MKSIVSLINILVLFIYVTLRNTKHQQTHLSCRFIELMELMEEHRFDSFYTNSFNFIELRKNHLMEVHGAHGAHGGTPI